jgi:hypothetical protein
MKTLMITLLTVLFYSNFSLACMPPMNHYMIQQAELQALFKDVGVNTKITQLAGQNGEVTSVTTVENGYRINLSTGCTFKATTQWKGSPNIGMCPSLGEFEVGEAVCPATL